MIVFTDNKIGAAKAFTIHQEWIPADLSPIDHRLEPWINRLYGDKPVYRSECRVSELWQYAFFVQTAPSSHFDLLVNSSQHNLVLPGGTLFVAGSGHSFHGQKGRPWAAQEGNIHLSVYFSPDKRIGHYHAGLPVLSAVSIVQAIDAVKDLSQVAQIKWVNDVLIHGKKVAGFLVHTQTVQDRVTGIILGIGLNVEQTPDISPDAIVVKAGSIREFLPPTSAITQKQILRSLLESLEKNYGFLLDGQYKTLLGIYRKRSAVIGRKVHIFSDTPNSERTPQFSGTVAKIGDNLELWLEGQNEPVTEGRLAFIVPHSEAA